MSNNIKVDLEQMTTPCCNCDADDEKYVVVVSKLGKVAEHYCLSCASALQSQLYRLMREVPTT